MHPTRLRLLGASFGLSLIAGVLSSCNILGPAMIIAEGPPKTKAQYTLPKERVTVVFIDDRRSYLPRRNLRDAIAGEASQRLLDNKAVMTVVNPRDAAAGVAGERNNAPIDLVTLTTNSKAEIMVYATIDDFQLFPDRETFQPTAVVRVKVIDAKAAEPRIWPEEREGKKLVITTLGPGTLFGEMALLGQQMHNAFAEAIEDCHICVMSRTDLERLFLNKPMVALRVLDTTGRRLREAEKRLEDMAFKGIPARLASLLLRVRSEQNSDDIKGLTHQDLAETVGTYRETATQVLNDLKVQGLIDIGRKRIMILDPESLQMVDEY